MAAFRGALYAAREKTEDWVENDVKEKFFPEQQRPTVSVGDFKQEPAASDTVDYAELNVRADVHILGMFTIPPFTAMWDGIAGASETRARAVADRIQDEVLNPDPDTIRKIRRCYDEYSNGTYRVCAFHKIAYDPDVPFSKD